MANPELFRSAAPGLAPRPLTKTENGTVTRNQAGGVAYDLGAKGALAQYACTGTLNGTFYATAQDQLKVVLELAKKCDSKYVSQVAIYSRNSAFMKDMPALLLAVLFSRSDAESVRLFKTTFPVVVDNAKMLRTFVQMVRSGVTGRKSLGTAGKKVISQWFEKHSPASLFRSNVGASPSLVDVIKLAHPRSGMDPERVATFDYLLDRKEQPFKEALPDIIKEFEMFKVDPKAATVVPKVPFQMLTSLSLSTKQWAEIALNGGWHFIRMNLNTFARHGVLKDAKVVEALAAKLKDPEAIANAKVFPYQLLMAYMATKDSEDIPMSLKLALQDAMEVATNNVPSLGGSVFVCPDVSGSMSSAITGSRPGATSKMTCIEVAALISASILRTSPSATILSFDTRVHAQKGINPRDSVVTNAAKLSAFRGGGTDVSSCLQHILDTKSKADTIIIVSDNESWFSQGNSYRNTTKSEAIWQQIKAKNPNCKLICIDLVPNATTQVSNEKNSVLNIGGFSDTVFSVVASFVSGTDTKFWVDRIETGEVPKTEPVEDADAS